MSHIGLVAPPFFSHFNALEALAGELMDLGHRVSRAPGSTRSGRRRIRPAAWPRRSDARRVRADRSACGG